MHNCRETQEQMIETILDGVDAGAEWDGCAECRTEFAALNATLRLTRRLSDSAPEESYWAEYHATLRQKIEEVSHPKAQRRKEAKKDLISSLRLFFAPLRLCLRTAIRVPVPLVVLTTLAFAALGLFAVRAAKQPTAQNPIIVHVPVEVPVVQEKVVTRVVYRDRRSPLRTSRRAINDARAESTFARSRKPSTEGISPGLSGFKPTEEIKLTVIKGGVPNEK